MNSRFYLILVLAGLVVLAAGWLIMREMPPGPIGTRSPAPPPIETTSSPLEEIPQPTVSPSLLDVCHAGYAQCAAACNQLNIENQEACHLECTEAAVRCTEEQGGIVPVS